MKTYFPEILTPSLSLAVMFNILDPGALSSHIVTLWGPDVISGTEGFLTTVNVKVAVAVFPGEPLSYAVTTS